MIHPDGSDVVYTFQAEGSFWDFLRGSSELRAHRQVTEDWVGPGTLESRVRGHPLRLSPEAARTLSERLAEGSVGGPLDGPQHRLGPLHDNGASAVADLLDQSLDGALSRQASFPVAGTRRQWLLERLQPRQGLHAFAELFLPPERQVPLSAWDARFLPDRLEALLARASIGGKPLVVESYGRMDEPQGVDPPKRGPWALGGILVALLIAGLLWPRLTGALVGGFAGALGLISLALALLGSGFGNLWNLLVLPPTHLAVPAWAFSRTRWASTRWLRRRYALFALFLGCGSAAASATGFLPSVSVYAGGIGIGTALLTLLGTRPEVRIRRGAPNLSAEYRPRAVSSIERRSLYVGRGGFRLR